GSNFASNHRCRGVPDLAIGRAVVPRAVLGDRRRNCPDPSTSLATFPVNDHCVAPLVLLSAVTSSMSPHCSRSKPSSPWTVSDRTSAHGGNTARPPSSRWYETGALCRVLVISPALTSER